MYQRMYHEVGYLGTEITQEGLARELYVQDKRSCN